MRRFLFFLALLPSLVLAGIPERLASSRRTTTPQDDLLFYWSAQTLFPEYLGFATKMGTDPMSLFDGATNSGGYVNIPNSAASFPWAFYNANSSGQSGFGYVTKGMLQLTWRYDSTVNNNVMISELGGKSNGGGGPGDSNDGASFIAVNSGGGESIKFGFAGDNGTTGIGSPNLMMYQPAPNQDRRMRGWWHNTRLRTLICQEEDYPPTAYIGTLPTTVCPVWNQFGGGNDTTLAMGFKVKEFYVYGDTPPQITGAFWQSFNFSGTVNQANLEANDHNPNAVWGVAGTNNFTTNNDAYIQSPIRINNQVDNGAYGLVRDINATAAGYVYTTVTAIDNVANYTFALRNAPTLNNNTGIAIAGMADGVGGNELSVVELNNTAGAYSITLRDGSFNYSGTITYVPGSDYWISVYTGRSSTVPLSYISVKTTSGAQVGVVRSVAASNRNATILYIGNLNTNTSQPAGTKVRITNLIFSTYYDTLPNAANWPYDVFTP